MQENGFYLTSFELEILFDRLDKNHDGKVTFNEFIHELIPKNSSY
jgi:Ca2+-binding EF-hand superfamily protein